MRVSPAGFWVIQTFVLCIPVIIIFAFIGGLARYSHMDFVGFFVYAIGTGGLASIFLIAYIGNSFCGLVGTPRYLWQVEVDNGIINIKTRRLLLSFPASKLKGFIYVTDDSWDRLEGQEDSGMILSFGWGCRVIVPGSSSGFDQLTTLAHRHPKFRVREMSS